MTRRYNARVDRIDYGLPPRNYTPRERMTNAELVAEMKRDTIMARRLRTKMRAKPSLANGQCCDEAKMFPCVCAYSWECAKHGLRHVGTHD